MIYHRKGEITHRGRKATAMRVAAVAAVAASVFIIAPVLATPGSGFTPTPLSKGLFAPLDVKADKTDKWDLFLKTKDASDIGVDHLSIAVDGQSGWHTHAGATFITVTSGEITWIDGVMCSATIYRAGDGFVEPANHPHLVRNASGSPAEVIAIQMRPKGTPGRIDAPQPNNCHL
jgi:quercetin dioxygenase-like cupin family protein